MQCRKNSENCFAAKIAKPMKWKSHKKVALDILIKSPLYDAPNFFLCPELDRKKVFKNLRIWQKKREGVGGIEFFCCLSLSGWPPSGKDGFLVVVQKKGLQTRMKSPLKKSLFLPLGLSIFAKTHRYHPPFPKIEFQGAERLLFPFLFMHYSALNFTSTKSRAKSRESVVL